MTRKSFLASALSILTFGLYRARAIPPFYSRTLMCLRGMAWSSFEKGWDFAADMEVGRANWLFQHSGVNRMARWEPLADTDHADDPYRDGYRWLVIEETKS